MRALTKTLVSATAAAGIADGGLATAGRSRRLMRRPSRPGTIDGHLGTNSGKAAQRLFKDRGHYNDSIDGIVGPNTVKALQRMLNFPRVVPYPACSLQHRDVRAGGRVGVRSGAAPCHVPHLVRAA